MVSMKNIAEACGVSIATVSKVLNGHDDIGKQTKELVWSKTAEMGYFPILSAKALRTNRTYNLGILFVDKSNSGLTHDYFASVINSFKTEAEEQGYDITFLNNKKKSKFQMSYLDHCRYRGLEGVVIACIDFNEPEVQQLLNSAMPVVTIDYVSDTKLAILSNNDKGMSDLLTYIHSRGHRRIAYLYGIDTAVTRTRVGSLRRTASELGIEIPDEYLRLADYRNVTKVCDAAEELFRLPAPPTCIICPDDFTAIGFMNVLRAKGLKIPDDISIAGYDGINMAEQWHPMLTTIRQDTDAIGRQAAIKLVNLIENPADTPVEIITIDGKLIAGESVKQQ